ncbi:hypothetical protein, partial [Staphylococcus agnetis]|uniref:hypothetical protein n=1 Tax=Staphylococcus agnetis TaxID=985762 RepID=UPI0039EB02F9
SGFKHNFSCARADTGMSRQEGRIGPLPDPNCPRASCARQGKSRYLRHLGATPGAFSIVDRHAGYRNRRLRVIMASRKQ